MGDSYAGSSEESVADDVYGDPDYTVSEDFRESDNSTIDNSVIDFNDFENWSDVSLEPVSKRNTKSTLWIYFGCLKKGKKIFTPTSKKYFCRPCFDDHKFKS